MNTETRATNHGNRSKRLDGSDFSAVELEKFWARVSVGGADECWEWTGFRMPKGYGSMTFHRSGKPVTFTSHKMAYAIRFGVVEEGEVVRHSVCDNPPCCNPAHMATGSHQDNSDDCKAKDRHRRERGNHWSKLTTQDVLSILALKQTSKITNRTIAKRFGVTPSNIGYIVKGKSRTNDVQRGPWRGVG